MASGTRRPGMEHIPRYPPGWITIRILQLIVSLICIGLGAYSATRRAVAGPLLTVWAVSHFHQNASPRQPSH